jgi:hypothetical protein
MAKDTPHLRLRIDPPVLAKLEKAAEKNGRTLTGEINHRLSESFKKDDILTVADVLSDKIVLKVTDVLRQGRVLTVSDFLKPLPDGEK